jgi:hypothetical protein
MCINLRHFCNSRDAIAGDSSAAEPGVRSRISTSALISTAGILAQNAKIWC